MGILRGRPFGGRVVHKSLSNCVSLCGFHQDNPAIAIKYTRGNMNFICVGVYWSRDRTSPDYSTMICIIFGFIYSVIDNHPGCHLV